jgi:SAM-dependent methyltransferase
MTITEKATNCGCAPGCCDTPAPAADSQRMREQVRAGYAAIATQPPAEAEASGRCGGTSCCGADTGEAAEMLARVLGYGAADLADLPAGANMGLSCGNPTALAALKPGEVVVDLGAGGGFDVFQAAKRVGPTGRAIGVDMTPEMLSKARRNEALFREKTGLSNAEFRLGEIEHLPLPDAVADVVISNCVINLSPDKAQVWREIARVLRPGGRVAVSDLALLRPLPPDVAAMIEALVGCVAGAVLVSDTERMAREAGLVDIVLEPKPDYVAAMEQWNDPLYARIAASLPAGMRIADYVTSLNVSARKG